MPKKIVRKRSSSPAMGSQILGPWRVGERVSVRNRSLTVAGYGQRGVVGDVVWLRDDQRIVGWWRVPWLRRLLGARRG